MNFLHWFARPDSRMFREGGIVPCDHRYCYRDIHCTRCRKAFSGPGTINYTPHIIIDDKPVPAVEIGGKLVPEFDGVSDYEKQGREKNRQRRDRIAEGIKAYNAHLNAGSVVREREGALDWSVDRLTGYMDAMAADITTLKNRTALPYFDPKTGKVHPADHYSSGPLNHYTQSPGDPTIKERTGLPHHTTAGSEPTNIHPSYGPGSITDAATYEDIPDAIYVMPEGTLRLYRVNPHVKGNLYHDKKGNRYHYDGGTTCTLLPKNDLTIGGPDPVTGAWMGSQIKIGTRVYVKQLQRVGTVVEHDDAFNHKIKFSDGSVGWGYGRVPNFLKDDGKTPLTDDDLTTVKGVEVTSDEFPAVTGMARQAVEEARRQKDKHREIQAAARFAAFLDGYPGHPADGFAAYMEQLGKELTPEDRRIFDQEYNNGLPNR